MQTKKLFLIIDGDNSTDSTHCIFSEKETADKLASFLEKNVSRIPEYQTRAVVVDELPIFQHNFYVDAAVFLRGEHVLKDGRRFVVDTQVDDSVSFSLVKQHFLLRKAREGFSTTWEELFLRGTEMICHATISYPLTKSELEDNSFSGERIEKAIERLRAFFSEDWLSRVAEEYPVTCVLVEKEKISFFLYRKGDAMLYNFNSKQDSEKNVEWWNHGVTFYKKKEERYTEYIFETKDGQKFLDTILDKIEDKA